MSKPVLILEKETDFSRVGNNQKIRPNMLVISKKELSNANGFVVNELQHYIAQVEGDINRKALEFLNNWSLRPLENGKNLRQLLELTPPYSWWWFMDRWLHRTPHYRNSLLEIFEAIELIELIIEVEMPGKIVVEDSGTLLGRIAGQVCQLKNIEFDFLRGSGTVSGIFESVRPYLVESLFKNVKFEIRRGFSRIFAKPMKRKIMVVTYGNCWTTVVDSFGKQKKGDRVSQQVIDQLGKKQKISGIDYDWMPYTGIKAMIEKRKFSIPFEYFYDSAVKSRAKADKKRISETWDFLKNSKTFRDSLNYRGVSLWGFMKNRIRFAFKARLPSFAKDFETTKRAIEKLEPKVIFMTFEANALGRAIVLAAHENKVKVVAMQHGMIKDFHPAYYHAQEDLKSYPLADMIAVYGSTDQDILTKNSFYPKNKVVLTGSPRHDIFANPAKVFNKEKIYKTLNLDKNKKLVVWTTQVSYQDITRANTEKLFKIANDLDFNLVVKLHPRDPLEEFYNEVAKKVNPNVKIVRKTETLELLNACDLMMTYWSTTALEAMALGKPIIAMTFAKELEKNPYTISGSVMSVNKPKKLEENIRKALQGIGLKKLEKKRHEFLKKHLYRIDGKATERVIRLIKKYV